MRRRLIYLELTTEIVFLFCILLTCDTIKVTIHYSPTLALGAALANGPT